MSLPTLPHLPPTLPRVAPSSSVVDDITSSLSWSSRSCQVGEYKLEQFFENRVCLAYSSTAIFAENVGWFRATKQGSGCWDQKMPENLLIKIQRVFFFSPLIKHSSFCYKLVSFQSSKKFGSDSFCLFIHCFSGGMDFWSCLLPHFCLCPALFSK